MIVTYRDELGLISIQMNDTYGLQFSEDVVYFTDKDDRDYEIPLSQMISVAKDNWYSAE